MVSNNDRCNNEAAKGEKSYDDSVKNNECKSSCTDKEINNDNGCCCKEDLKDNDSCCNNDDNINSEKSCCCSCDDDNNTENDDKENNKCEEREDAEFIEELKSKLRSAEQKRDEYLAIAQRTQADFENFRRRNKTAVADAYKASAAETIEAFLPVIDNMERAYESALAAGSDENFTKGLEMMIRQFKDILAKFDVEEIEALGKPFNPEIHNAFMQVEAEEGQPSDIVVEVLQKGYRMKDKVIRYSMVKVTK